MGVKFKREQRCVSAAVVMTVLSGFHVPIHAQSFRRGDVNTDGRVDIGDSTFLQAALFTGEVTLSCLDAADADDSGDVNITDEIRILNWAFLGIGSFPAPGPSACGTDPTADALDCDSYPAALCDPQPPRAEDSRFEFRIDAPPSVEGPSGGTAVFEVTVETCASVGVASWSLGVAGVGCEIVSQTIAGTLAALESQGGLRDDDNSFESTLVIDPSKNGGQNGVVSAVVLEVTVGTSLPVTGTGVSCSAPSPILKLTVEADVPGTCCAPCQLAFTDGLVGDGQPIPNVVAVRNATREVAKPVLIDAAVDVGPEPLIEFRRGDANADGRVTLADPVWIVNALFRGGPEIPCEAAADANADRLVDASDLVFLANWLYRGGPPPPAPGPVSCGPDPFETPCNAYPGGCDVPPPLLRDPRARLYFEGPAILDPGTTADVSVLLDSTIAIEGFNVNAGVTAGSIMRVSPGTAVAPGADFVAASIQGTWGGAGVILDSVPPFDGATVPAGSHREILKLELLAPSSGCGSTFSFLDDVGLGPGPRETTLVAGGLEVRPLVESLTIPLGSEPLAAGTPLAWPLGACRLFRVDPPFAGALVASLTGANPLRDVALYLRFGSPPTPSIFDAAADARGRSSQRLVAADPPALPAFVLVQSNGSGASSNVTLLVEDVALALESISADSSRTGGSGLLHASILGAGFQPETTFRLEPSSGTGPTIHASSTLLVSAARAEVVFALAGAPAAGYDLAALTPALGQSARLDGSFTTLATGIGPRLEVSILGTRQGSRAFRYDRPARLTLEYRNTGDEEMPAPLFKITGPPGTELKLARDEAYQPGEIQVLGIHPNGVSGWLPPGGGWQIPVEFRSTACRNCPIVFEVLVFTPSAGDAVGWDVLPPPGGMSPAGWERAWPGLSRRFGGVWQGYARGLAELSRRLSHRGEDATSVLRLFRFAAREALGRPSSALTGVLAMDGSGERLPGRTILAREGATVASSAITDAQGAFALDWLEGGNDYDLAILDHAVVGTSLGSRRVTIPTGGDVLGLEVLARAEENSLAPGCANCNEDGLPLRPLAPPAELFALAARWEADLVSSWDPNDKDGPEGEDRDERTGLIPPDVAIEYTIHFENLPQAGASAQEVVVTDFLDPLVHDVSTVRLRRVEIAGFRLDLDIEGQELASGYTRDLAFERFEARRLVELGLASSEPGEPTSLDVVFEASVGGGAAVPAAVVSWTFVALTDDPLLGFLDPNCKPGCDCASLPVSGPDDEGCKDGRGEGLVAFSVMPLPQLPEGTVVENRAEVSFDGQPHVGGPLQWENEISYFQPPPPPGAPQPPSGAEVTGPDVTLAWEAPGAQGYDVYVWLAGEERGAPVGSNFTGTSFTASALLPGERYLWQVIARGADGGTESPVWAFATTPSGPCPARPVAMSPPEGAADLPGNVSFAWSVSPAPEPGSISYDILLWKLGQPDRRVLASGLFLPAFEAPIELEPGATYEWQVVAQRPGCRKESDVRSFSIEQRSFRRGDPNADATTNITDAIFLLNYLFSGGPTPPCEKSADADDGGTVDITDGILLLNYLFASGRAPALPFEDCGLDPGADGLGCIDYPDCP